MTREEASFYLANMDRKYMEEGMSEALDMVIKALEQERSRSAEITQYRHDCEKLMEENERLKKALEQEPCKDAISRRAVMDLIEHYNSDGLGSVFYGYEQGVKFADAVNKLPSVSPQPKMGRWIQKEEEGEAEPFIIWECSECHCVDEDGKPSYKYCPQRGCKMEVKE